MPRTGHSPLDLDILHAALGCGLPAPYARAFGPVPWLTAGTLTWPADAAQAVLPAWRAWVRRLPASALSAVRLGHHVVAVDVALRGDPWGAGARLAPLRDLAPDADTVGIAAPAELVARRGCVALASAPLAVLPDATVLLDVAAADGVCAGLRHDPARGPAAIALGIAGDAPRLAAAVAGVERALRSHVPAV